MYEILNKISTPKIIIHDIELLYIKVDEKLKVVILLLK